MMTEPTTVSVAIPASPKLDLDQFTNLELAQALSQRLMIREKDWHRLKNNRQARAAEQAITALVYLLKSESQEALPRLQQACGWLDQSISAPPCPSHGTRSPKS